jgi:hypothetical protein
LPVLCDGPLNQGFALGLVRDIRRDRNGLATSLATQASYSGQLLLTARGKGKVCALRSQLQRNLSSDPE